MFKKVSYNVILGSPRDFVRLPYDTKRCAACCSIVLRSQRCSLQLPSPQTQRLTSIPATRLGPISVTAPAANVTDFGPAVLVCVRPHARCGCAGVERDPMGVSNHSRHATYPLSTYPLGTSQKPLWALARHQNGAGQAWP